MPGGGKKAAFPPLNLHDHDQIRIFTNEQDRQKKYLQHRGKSFELKESPEKERTDVACKGKGKSQQGGSGRSGDRSPCGAGAAKPDQQKTPTKSDQKALLKLEQQIIKSEQKAQQKLEKEYQKEQLKLEREQLKLEKEHQKEQLKLEKEQMKLEKEQQREQQRLEREQQKSAASSSKNCFKTSEKMKVNDYFNLGKDAPTLKSQRSIDVSCLKHQKSTDSMKIPARKSVDMQYAQNLLEGEDMQSLNIGGSPTAKPKNKK